MLEAARSQIAGTVSHAEVQSAAAQRPQLPRAGASRSRRVADQRREHAALPRDVRRARRQPVGRQPAQSLEQLHRRRAVGQRRRRGAERHHVRGRRHRAVPGGDVRRTGRARARAGRLRQRRDQERHQRPARHGLRLHPRRPLQRQERAAGREAADEPDAVRREPRRADRVRIARSTSRTSSSAGSISPVSSRSGPRTSPVDQRASGRDRLSGPARRHRRVSESRRFDERARQGRSPAEQTRSVQRPLQPLRRQLPELARRRRAQRPERVVRAGQPRSDDRGQQHADALDRARCSRRAPSSPTAT